jgi:uncharacterized protein YegL
MTIGRGYSSLPPRKKMADRFQQSGKGRLILLQLADFNNPENRCACVLLLDVSASMAGNPIAELNAGLVTYKDELAADSLASKRVEVAVVTFSDQVQTICDFTTAQSFQPPNLTAGGSTAMGAAIQSAVEMVNQRKAVYKANGIAYYRPWIFLITDGAPTDRWDLAAQNVKEGEAARAFAFYAAGVEGANFEVLKQISVREPVKLKSLRFRDLFKWLSDSQKAVSRSTPGDTIPLPTPTGPSGWAEV